MGWMASLTSIRGNTLLHRPDRDSFAPQALSERDFAVGIEGSPELGDGRPTSPRCRLDDRDGVLIRALGVNAGSDQNVDVAVIIACIQYGHGVDHHIEGDGRRF